MIKHAQAVVEEPLNETARKSLTNAERLQLKKETEAAIRTQLAEFAKEFEQLKRLHKSH